MLDLDSDTRITATQALAHPYLRQYADPSDEPEAETYDQSWEDMEVSIEEWRSKSSLLNLLTYLHMLCTKKLFLYT